MKQIINQKINMSFNRLLGMLLLSLCMVPAMAFAQPAPIPFHKEVYTLQAGGYKGLEAESLVAFREVVQISGAPWLQLHFSDYNLGKQSYITITSLKDGGQQRLDSNNMKNWYNSSAYFNGDAVEVELHAEPGEKGIFFRIDQISVGEWMGSNLWIESLCGGDDRVASNDPAVGRIVPAGCTGWIVSNGAHLTAGHCAGSMGTIEFNVPQSLCDGTIVHPGPDDQYPINGNSIVFADDGLVNVGDDYAVFACNQNANTRLLPVQAQSEFYRMSRDDKSPASVVVTGYGMDDTPRGCTNGRNSDNQTQQVHSGDFLREVIEGPSDSYLEYTVDTQGGNSGSPVIIAGTALTIGIHTNGGCYPPGEGNIATSFENDNLESAIQRFPGTNVVYADRDHPAVQKDGTVFRPYSTVLQAVNAATSGAIVSIVKGSYSETMTINKVLTLVAPVGAVTIGQ